jgi:hypothetical protein
MCERAMEQEHTKEVKDLAELSHFDIKIEVKGIGLEITITTQDPLDCVTMAGMIISHLRRWGKEPTVVILP